MEKKLVIHAYKNTNEYLIHKNYWVDNKGVNYLCIEVFSFDSAVSIASHFDVVDIFKNGLAKTYTLRLPVPHNIRITIETVRTVQETVVIFDSKERLQSSDPLAGFEWTKKHGKYIAQDPSGEWYSFSTKPIVRSTMWDGPAFINLPRESAPKETKAMLKLVWYERIFKNPLYD